MYAVTMQFDDKISDDLICNFIAVARRCEPLVVRINDITMYYKTPQGFGPHWIVNVDGQGGRAFFPVHGPEAVFEYLKELLESRYVAPAPKPKPTKMRRRVKLRIKPRLNFSQQRNTP